MDSVFWDPRGCIMEAKGKFGGHTDDVYLENINMSTVW